MKAGKWSENGKLRPVDSQKESSTGALEGLWAWVPGEGRARLLLLLLSSKTDTPMFSSDRVIRSSLYQEGDMGTRLAQRTPEIWVEPLQIN